MIRGEARIVGPGAVEVRGPDGHVETLEAASVIVAAGSAPFVPPIPGRRRGAVLDEPGCDVDARAPVEPGDPGRRRGRGGDGAGLRPVRGPRHARRGRRPHPLARPPAHVEGMSRTSWRRRARPPHRGHGQGSAPAAPGGSCTLGRLDRRGRRAAGGGRAARRRPPRVRAPRTPARRSTTAERHAGRTDPDRRRPLRGRRCGGRPAVHARRRLRRRDRRPGGGGRPDQADLRVVPKVTFTDPEASAVGLTVEEAQAAGIDAFEISQGLREHRQRADHRRCARAPDGGGRSGTQAARRCVRGMPGRRRADPRGGRWR